MEFGLFVVTQYEMDRAMDGIADELITQTELARDLGFSSIQVGEHHVTDEHQYLLNEPVIAHVAEHVGDMGLATGMCLLPYHNPVRVAEYGATMDVLTGGQFTLGVALGYRQQEFDVFGVERSDALGRLVEGVEIIKRLWTEESVTYDGDHFQLDEVSVNPKPIQEPRPDVVVGASNESSVRRAARIADGWLGAHVPFGQATDQAGAFRDEREKEGADEGFVGIAREVFVADTTEKAEAAVKDHLMGKYESYSEWGQDDVIEGDDFGSPWEKLKHERFLVGTPAEVCEELERYEASLDPDMLVVRTQYPGMEFEDVHRSIELLGEEVLPEVREKS